MHSENTCIVVRCYQKTILLESSSNLCIPVHLKSVDGLPDGRSISANPDDENSISSGKSMIKSWLQTAKALAETTK